MQIRDAVNRIISKEQFSLSMKNWLVLNMSLLAIMLLSRLFFMIATYIHFQLNCSYIIDIFSGSIFDIILLCHIAVFTLIPYVVLEYYFPKIAKKTFSGAIVLYAILSVLLTIYFCITKKPLDHVILVYSPSDVINTALSSISISVAAVLFFMVVILSSLIVLHYILKIKISTTVALCFFLIFATVSVSVNYKRFTCDESGYDTKTEFYLAVNQVSFFVIDIFDYLGKEDKNISNGNIKNEALVYQKLHPQFEYTCCDYPFERKNSDSDKIGHFFETNQSPQLPNFVFIIIEGLGERLTGTEEQTYVVTPFLDSLAQRSLYWKNCISSAERTFGVLPAIFASVPHGEKGFSNVGRPIPEHNSLLKDLQKNGYYTSFFYGGSQSFDGQDEFVKANNISFILEIEKNSINKNKKFAASNRWGLDDAELFALAQKRKSQENKTPFADIYLTLTTHEPFDFEGIKNYEKQIRNEAQNIKNEKERENVLNNLNVFACFQYLDDCVRNLMDFYKTLPGYDNTIFIITGDHRMCPLLVWEDPLMKYNVPLIIYSPLLKRSKTMECVVSHYDITPSINTFLSNNYSYNTDEICHWLGNSFDTTAEFQCKKRQAFMLNNRTVSDYLRDTFFVCDKNVYRVGKDLLIQKIDSVELLEKLTKELNNYQSLSVYVNKNNRLIHDLSNKKN